MHDKFQSRPDRPKKVNFFLPLSYMYVRRRKANVLVTPGAVHEQCNAGKKRVPLTRRVRIVIKHVHLVIYLNIIKHAHERASFCKISKAGLATGRKVMSPVDAVI